MSKTDKLKSDLISWNNTFPRDRLYRQNQGILFNSSAHRQLCQIDIFMDWLEAELFNEFESEIIETENKEARYKKGIWLQKKEEEMTDEDFEKIVI